VEVAAEEHFSDVTLTGTLILRSISDFVHGHPPAFCGAKFITGKDFIYTHLVLLMLKLCSLCFCIQAIP
jgi:hypothetical protein